MFYANKVDAPIFGPDKISVNDCIDLIDNTVGYCKLLICRSPPPARATLSFVIDQIAKEGRKCCYVGGVWKGCFQPLANKYHEWNQKWKVFGIPPDPAWD